jgi:serine O-acetyltransferase
MLKIIYPGYYWDREFRTYTTSNKLSLLMEDIIYNLNKQIAIALRFSSTFAEKTDEERNEEAQRITLEFFSAIPGIREYLETDIEAAFDGDPAAGSKDEIILSYPGLLAITVNRIAHELYLRSVPLIPRMMTEYAHSKTGIDIHPGATIGKYFFIDHGASILGGGTVIGKNVVIGSNAFVTKSIAEGTRVSIRNQELQFKADTRTPVQRELEADEAWYYTI